MPEKKPFLDEIIFEKIRTGSGTYDDILSLKEDYDISILEIVGTLQRLEECRIIIRLQDKFVINERE